MQTVLTIAGFDPSSGAGITADLMVFAAHALFGTSAITALTVQSTVGVRSTHTISADVLRDTLSTLHADLPPAGIKIGMLATAANVAVVCDYLEAIRRDPSTSGIPAVLDPVMRSSSGRELLDPEGITILRQRLLPLVDWITPNLDELATLSGHVVATNENISLSARTIQKQTTVDKRDRTLGIFATGGHLNPPDDLLLAPDGEEAWLHGQHIATPSTHGTGCALSSAFLSRLVFGDTPFTAAQAAKAYVTGSLQHAIPRGAGHGPLHHLWEKLR